MHVWLVVKDNGCRCCQGCFETATTAYVFKKKRRVADMTKCGAIRTARRRRVADLLPPKERVGLAHWRGGSRLGNASRLLRRGRLGLRDMHGACDFGIIGGGLRGITLGALLANGGIVGCVAVKESNRAADGRARPCVASAGVVANDPAQHAAQDSATNGVARRIGIRIRGVIHTDARVIPEISIIAIIRPVTNCVIRPCGITVTIRGTIWKNRIGTIGIRNMPIMIRKMSPAGTAVMAEIVVA